MAAKAKVNLKIDEVLEEQDVFRLAIRGYVAVESFIDETIAEAFGGSTPVVLRRLPVRARLALLGALTRLGLVPGRRRLLVALPLLFVAASLRGLLVVQRLGGRLPAGVAIKRAVWARIGHRLRFPGLPAT